MAISSHQAQRYALIALACTAALFLWDLCITVIIGVGPKREASLVWLEALHVTRAASRIASLAYDAGYFCGACLGRPLFWAWSVCERVFFHLWPAVRLVLCEWAKCMPAVVYSLPWGCIEGAYEFLKSCAALLPDLPFAGFAFICAAATALIVLLFPKLREAAATCRYLSHVHDRKSQ